MTGLGRGGSYRAATPRADVSFSDVGHAGKFGFEVGVALLLDRGLVGGLAVLAVDAVYLCRPVSKISNIMQPYMPVRC